MEPVFNSTVVKGVQRVLFCRGHGGSANSINDFSDGLFGPVTENAVRDFQAAEGLAIGDVVGSATWGRMQELVEAANIGLLSDNSKMPTPPKVSHSRC